MAFLKELTCFGEPQGILWEALGLFDINFHPFRCLKEPKKWAW